MNDDSLESRRWLDRITDEFKAKWRPSQRPDFESYLSRASDEQRDDLFKLLLEIDVDLRQKDSQEVDVDDYTANGDSAKQIVAGLSKVTRAQETASFEPKQFPRRRADESSQIGPYKLLQKIGEGGMGTVWMAEQERPVRRRVALKLIRSGAADKQTIARFEAERQALAMMDHQNIAKVLDAGACDDGSPFFVMELVQGIPINKYCDRNKLTPRERLELFIPVCKAVQHAHQKGIIHRDLKPSNVLVQIHDAKPIAKVIDFGLAKALQHQTKLTDKTMFTEFGQVVGTVQYMSPEQAMLDALNVDTRTDIYSLGVMLYELLAGSTPIDQETLKKNALLEVLDIIREKDPPRPSHRLSTRGDSINTIAEQRHLHPSKLQHILRGDLDWIVMKALEKDRTRRYETANGFALDLQRFLDKEPVAASPPSPLYRLRKFVQRNRIATIAALAVLIMLMLGVVGTSIGLVAAKAEKARATQRAAEAEDRFELALAAIEKYYEGVSEDVLLKEPELKELRTKLLQSARDFYKQLEHDLKGSTDPKKQMALAKAISNVARISEKIGFDGDAEDGYRNAIAIYRQLNQNDQTDETYQFALASELARFGRFQFHELRNHKISEELARESIDIFESLIDGNPAEPKYRNGLASVYIDLGNLLHEYGELEASAKSYQKSIDATQKLVAEYPAVPKYQASLANGYWGLTFPQKDLGDFAAAKKSYQEAIDIFETLVNKKLSHYRINLSRLHQVFGSFLRQRGELEASAKSYQKSIDTTQKLVAEYPAVPKYQITLAKNYENLGDLQQIIGELSAAKDSYQAVIAACEKSIKNNPEVGGFAERLVSAYYELGNVHILEGSPKSAKESYESGIKISVNMIEEKPDSASAKFFLVQGKIKLGHVQKMEGKAIKSSNLYQQAIEVCETQLRQNPDDRFFQSQLSEGYIGLGNLNIDRGFLTTAKECHKNAIEINQKLASNNPSDAHSYYLADSYVSLGNALLRARNIVESKKSFQKAIEIFQDSVQKRPNDYINLAGLAVAHVRLGNAKDFEGDLTGAEKSYQQAIEICRNNIKKKPALFRDTSTLR